MEGLDPLDLKSIAAVQYQGGDCQGVLNTLKGQEDIMSLMLRGKAEFGLGSFQSAAALFKKVKGMVSSVDATLRPEFERQCTVWNNKSQIELTSTRSYGDINQGAYLNTAAPQNPSMFTPTEPAKTTTTTTATSSTA